MHCYCFNAAKTIGYASLKEDFLSVNSTDPTLYCNEWKTSYLF